MPVYPSTQDLPPIDTLFIVDILELMRNIAARTRDDFATNTWLKKTLTRAFVDCFNLSLINKAIHRPEGFYTDILKTFAEENLYDKNDFYKIVVEELEKYIKLTTFRYAYWIGGTDKLSIIYKEITAFVIHQTNTLVAVIADLRSEPTRRLLDRATLSFAT